MIREADTLEIFIRDPIKPGKNEIQSELEELKNVLKVSIVICIIPKDDQTYGLVKRVAEINVGILTVCIRSSDLKNEIKDVKYLLQRINSILNGVNRYLHQSCIPFKRCMFVGEYMLPYKKKYW